ncbi:MAG: hypothetical protein PHF72_02905 [Gammaproteobacteria bacterium]|nr:hypothetical protein [Gammaproteobacteria bacterium]
MKNVKSLLLSVGLLALSAPALAFHCPADMKKIDAAMERGTGLNEQQLAEVKALRAEGEEQHKAGRHAESVATLARAMEMLGIR